MIPMVASNDDQSLLCRLNQSSRGASARNTPKKTAPIQIRHQRKTGI